jgi:hypothetical protein
MFTHMTGFWFRTLRFEIASLPRPPLLLLLRYSRALQANFIQLGEYADLNDAR